MRKLIRTSAAATGLVAALALTGCGGDGDSGGDPAKDSGATASSGTGGESGSDAGSGADSASVEGTWAGLTDGKAVALSVKSGKVALVAAEHVCQGSIKDMGEPMFALKCADGDTERTMGTIESNDGKTLVVSWDAGKKDTLRKTESGSTLPSGLPTSLPTG